jgi:NhaP-type Na+/H+ or K+/H+ antiporter
MHVDLGEIALLMGAFLVIAPIIHSLTKRFRLPYTIIVFLIGLLLKSIHSVMGQEFRNFFTTDVIYFILLPLLLFESAIHFNIRQFRLQFKTITT